MHLFFFLFFSCVSLLSCVSVFSCISVFLCPSLFLAFSCLFVNSKLALSLLRSLFSLISDVSCPSLSLFSNDNARTKKRNHRDRNETRTHSTARNSHNNTHSPTTTHHSTTQHQHHHTTHKHITHTTKAVCTFKTLPCVLSKRSRVCRQNARVPCWRNSFRLIDAEEIHESLGSQLLRDNRSADVRLGSNTKSCQNYTQQETCLTRPPEPLYNCLYLSALIPAKFKLKFNIPAEREQDSIPSAPKRLQN